jgi:hypothetical protein
VTNKVSHAFSQHSPVQEGAQADFARALNIVSRSSSTQST